MKKEEKKSGKAVSLVNIECSRAKCNCGSGSCEIAHSRKWAYINNGKI